MRHKIIYLIALQLLSSYNIYAQTDTSAYGHYEDVKINNTLFSVIESSKENADREFLTIDDSTELKIIDTLLRIHKTDTFLVHRYYRYGNLIRTAEYDLVGTLRDIANWNDGKVHGTTLSFDHTGQLTSLTHYDNWNLIHTIDIDSLGHLVGFHINDSLFEKSCGKEYYSSGSLKGINSATWESGEHMDIRYYENGQLMSKFVQNAGRQNAIHFYENGSIMAEYDFVDMTFLIVGRLVEYYPNGQIKHKAFYEESESREGAGIRTGTWKWWDEEGNLIRLETYKKNVLMDKKEIGGSTYRK